MKPIPIKAAKEIAEKYGYDQVMIYARKVGVTQKAPAGDWYDDGTKEYSYGGGEHMTTYGINKEHCKAMAKIAQFLQTKIMGWNNGKDS